MNKFVAQSIIAIFALAFLYPMPATASVGNWQRGISMYPLSSADFGSEQMHLALQETKNDNANIVTFIIPYYEKSKNNPAMAAGYDTPSDASLTQATTWAHELGLAVEYKIHLDSNDAAWRAYIDPPDRDTWFTNYEKVLTHYVALANQNKVEQICIGTELISLSSDYIHPDNTSHWEKLIADLRQVYPGQLIYSANWGPDGGFADEKNHIAFWDRLDYIGISAYFQLRPGDETSAALTNSWQKWYEFDVLPLSQHWNKQVIFTEIGYRSDTNSHQAPYEFKGKGIYDAQEQVSDYDALFTFWNDKSELGGVSLWDFYANPAAGGPGNTDYTPQNKPAEAVLQKWFGTKPDLSGPNRVFVPEHYNYVLETIKKFGGFLHSFPQFS